MVLLAIPNPSYAIINTVEWVILASTKFGETALIWYWRDLNLVI